MNNENNNLNSQNINANMVQSNPLLNNRKRLHNDSIILLIVSIIGLVGGLILAGLGSNPSLYLFLESIVYFIFLIIIVENKNKIKKYIGVLALIVSSLMILFGIINHTILDIIYIILSINFIIDSIRYLKSFNGYLTTNMGNIETKNDKLKYVSLVLVLSWPLVIAFSVFIPLTFIECFMIIFVMAVASLIIDIILIVKKMRSVLVYICLAFSILLTIIAANYIPGYIDYFNEKISNIKEQNSEEYKLNEIIKAESYFRIYAEKMVDDGFIERPIANNKIIVSKKRFLNLKENYKLESEYEYKELVEVEKKLKKYSCDGYAELYLDYTYDKKGRISGKSYINCTGKYKYKTDGFNNNKLK